MAEDDTATSPPPTAIKSDLSNSPNNTSHDVALQQQQQTLLQQQLQQQQLQLLQLQQQQLQSLSLSHNLSASDLSALQTQTQTQQQTQTQTQTQTQQQQQQLALFMMPMSMFPLLMPPLPPQLQQTLSPSGAPPETLLTAAEAASASTHAAADAASEAAAAAAVAAGHSDVLPSYAPASAEALGLADAGFGFIPGSTVINTAATTTGVLNMDDVPKRKRGRPPKKDAAAAARAKVDADKALKQQLPLWGYGLPLPLLPGFPPGMLSGMSNPGAMVMKDYTTAAAIAANTAANTAIAAAGDCGDEMEHEGDAERPSKMAKKKQRGTGKPRGRPRTRPRPGEIIRRVKPLPIAPANFSVMYNYSLSNLAHKSAELHGDGSVADTTTTAEEEAQDRGLASLSASLLSGEHE